MAKQTRVTKATKAIHFEESSGNVFADLGLPDADERLIKAQLAIEIGRILKQRKLTQQAAAKLMGIDQPKVSHLVHGRLGGSYSAERLLHFLIALGRDVEIVLRTPPRSRRQGRLRVVAA
jgi:predicted XRE-type DNA-binding protein